VDEIKMPMSHGMENLKVQTTPANSKHPYSSKAKLRGLNYMAFES
jgi:hypothetical protein